MERQFAARQTGGAEIAAIAAQLYDAIRTLAALPDRERAWLSDMRSYWPTLAPGFWEEFSQVVVQGGHAAVRLRRIAPTPESIDRMLPTLQWLTWLDERARKLIWLRAFGVPWWKIGARYGRSDKTMQRWHDDALALIQRRLHLQAGAALAPAADRL